jgi:leucyl/phenylalanyl-tRNA--protein transferase
MIPWLDPSDPFPPLTTALDHPNGLLAAGADLSEVRLLDAYAHGIFPWFGHGEPVLWWSPDPRMVLWLDALHVSRSLRRLLASGRYTVTMDTAFDEVIEGCAEPGAGREQTWITPDMMEAYRRLARLGRAHSVEVWTGGRLAGGLYGVALGRMFYGESMFSRAPGASKVALVALVRQLGRWGFGLIDCQMPTSHLASFGAREIPRAEFMRHVERLVRLEGVAPPWSADPDLLQEL